MNDYELCGYAIIRLCYDMIIFLHGRIPPSDRRAPKLDCPYLGSDAPIGENPMPQQEAAPPPLGYTPPSVGSVKEVPELGLGEESPSVDPPPPPPETSATVEDASEIPPGSPGGPPPLSHLAIEPATAAQQATGSTAGVRPTAPPSLSPQGEGAAPINLEGAQEASHPPEAAADTQKDELQLKQAYQFSIDLTALFNSAKESYQTRLEALKALSPTAPNYQDLVEQISLDYATDEGIVNTVAQTSHEAVRPLSRVPPWLQRPLLTWSFQLGQSSHSAQAAAVIPAPASIPPLPLILAKVPPTVAAQPILAKVPHSRNTRSRLGASTRWPCGRAKSSDRPSTELP